MKVQNIQKLLHTEILPRLKDWKVCDRFIYLREPEDILRGIYLAGSSSPTVVYVEAFVMPLYMPASTIYFNLGIRLKDSNGWERWSLDILEPDVFVRDLLDAINQDGIPWLARFATPKLLIKQLSTSSDFTNTQILAYSLAYEGNTDAAIECLAKVEAEAESDVHISPWLKPISERARYLIKLLYEGPNVAKNQLLKWVDETRNALHLPSREQ